MGAHDRDVQGGALTATLRTIALRQFRSYEQVALELPAGVVALTGPNGVGKTNLLEACAWALTGSSPRTSSEANCVRHGSTFFRVDALLDVAGQSSRHVVTFELGKGRRLVADDVVATTVEEFARRVPAVVFLPEKLLVVRGAPARRRAVVDRLLSRLDVHAAHVASEYMKAMTQRNALLRQARARGRVDEAALAPWTQQIADLGEQYRRHRSAAVDALRPRFRERFEQLTGFVDGTLELELRGHPLGDALVVQRPLDEHRATTSAGPHLDDVRFLQGRRDLRAFGSTGEQRAALLAWALAETDVVTVASGIAPVLLLDEPFAELDPDRRERLLGTLYGLPQVVLTTTEPPLAPARLHELAPNTTLLAVSSGAVHPWPETTTT